MACVHASGGMCSHLHGVKTGDTEKPVPVYEFKFLHFHMPDTKLRSKPEACAYSPHVHAWTRMRV